MSGYELLPCNLISEPHFAAEGLAALMTVLRDFIREIGN